MIATKLQSELECDPHDDRHHVFSSLVPYENSDRSTDRPTVWSRYLWGGIAIVEWGWESESEPKKGIPTDLTSLNSQNE